MKAAVRMLKETAKGLADVGLGNGEEIKVGGQLPGHPLGHGQGLAQQPENAGQVQAVAEGDGRHLSTSKEAKSSPT